MAESSEEKDCELRADLKSTVSRTKKVLKI